MRITKVTLQNWGPYKGAHVVDIDVTQNSPLVVIWGKNGGGKTKFIDALKWVFSGGDLGYIKVGPYINISAIADGDEFKTSVTVDFEQNQQKFRVTREITVDPAHLEDPASQPAALESRLLKMPDKSNAVLEKVGEIPYSIAQSKLVLLRLFPARLVNFYFFDAAELIESFKRMSNVEGNYSSTLDIQNSVETAMGFKGFETYIENLRQLETELRSKVDSDIRDKTRLNSLKESKSNLVAKQRVIETDIQHSRETIAISSAELLEKHQILEGMGEALELQSLRSELKAQLRVNKESLNNTRLKISELFPLLWPAPILSQIKYEQEELRKSQAAHNSWQDALASQRLKIESLARALSEPHCTHCGRAMTEEAKLAASEAILQEEKNLEVIKSSQPELSKSYDARKDMLFNDQLWNGERESQLNQFLLLTKQIEKLKIDIVEAEQKVSGINVQLGHVGGIDFMAVNSRILELEKLIDSLEDHIQKETESLAEISSEITKFDRQIVRLAAGSGSVAQARLIKLEKLLQGLSFILLELKNNVRKEIEAESNVILQSLVSPADAKFRISISEDYALSTDKFNPNAGFKQQLVLAFLFAIPRVARAPFPVVIDSPLQHMGVENRENFLKWCTSGLSQLVLLPHDAELEIPEVERKFGDSLSRFYELVHNSDSKTSEVKRLR